MKVLVTGAAGFIGSHLCRRLAETRRCEVLGVDNLSDYYDVALKRARLAALAPLENFRWVQLDIAEAEKYSALHAQFQPDYVAHLGAQAGVRHSIAQPAAYVRNNITGFLNVLEACRDRPPKHLVFASSSSVYGAGARVPFSEDQAADRPVSFYGATKRANELMAHSYAHLHGLNVTGARFFTVYGPWGRPDMTPIIFATAICAGEPLKLFNEGKNRRDFTHVDDIVDGLLKLLLYPPPPGQRPVPPFRIFNLGHHRPVEMRLFVEMLESVLGQKARLELLPPEPGDMVETCADLTRVHAAIGYAPRVTLEDGLRGFAEWFRGYYRP
ncbi:MAG: NAD-dependent epimerase/dehydratase family protein [Verrucomicrobiota bacterium]